VNPEPCPNAQTQPAPVAPIELDERPRGRRIKQALAVGQSEPKPRRTPRDVSLPLRPWQVVAKLPWPELLERVRTALSNLQHPVVREQVLERLRARGYSLPDCLHHPEAREALADSLTATEDRLELDHPQDEPDSLAKREARPLRGDVRHWWADRWSLRDIRLQLEWKLWP
jgi:hypothetical protein